MGLLNAPAVYCHIANLQLVALCHLQSSSTQTK